MLTSAKNAGVKLFSCETASEMERKINNWMKENPKLEIVNVQFQLGNYFHVMLMYENLTEDEA